VVGGGSKLDPLRSLFHNLPLPHPWIQRVIDVNVGIVEPEVVGASRTAPRASETAELICVLGTAIPPWETRRFKIPDQVPVEAPPTLRNRAFDHNTCK
jgi:hypothetical protein